MSASWRSPAPGRPVSLGEPVTTATVAVVTYEDERYPFDPGAWGRFGRDDDVCEIPVWEEVRADRLSRIAGELWAADGQLWLRNLSRSHELSVYGESGLPVHLPPRAPGERGRACSVPPRGHIASPSAGEWLISVETLDDTSDTTDDGPSQTLPADPGTSRVGPVPPRLHPVAAALCAPLLEDAVTPATYDEVARRLGLTRRQARRSVEGLCAHYADALSQPRRADDAATPTYVHLARLLVTRGLVRRADLMACTSTGVKASPVAATDAPAPTGAHRG